MHFCSIVEELVGLTTMSVDTSSGMSLHLSGLADCIRSLPSCLTGDQGTNKERCSAGPHT